MGDRYTLNLRCDWCGEENEDVWYAPSSSVTSFKCEHCGKENKITMNFNSKRIEKRVR